MKTDKRPLYLWAIVLVVNIFVALEILLFNISRDHPLLTTWDVKIMGAVLFITIIPVLISGSKIKFKHYLGYGIPVLFLLSTLWLMYQHHLCEPVRSFLRCGPEPLSIQSEGLLSIISALFYTLGIYARKLNVKFVLFILIAVFVLSVGSLLHLDSNILHRIQMQYYQQFLPRPGI